MSYQQSRESIGALLVHAVACPLDDHHASIGNRRRQATRGRDVTIVELSGHEGARTSDARKLIPNRPHRAGAHPAQGFRQPRAAVVQPPGPYLPNVGWAPSFQTGEERQAAPVVDEGLESVVLNALRQGLIVSAPVFALVLFKPRMGPDGQERQGTCRPRGRDVEREPAPHRVSDQMAARDPKMVPEHLEIFRACLHRVERTRLDAGIAMTAQVWHHPPPAIGHLRDDLVPAAPALGEPVKQGDRRTFADHLIVEANVSAFQNHDMQIVWM